MFALIDQISNLYHNSAWFRADERLRELAVAEILLFATGADRQVPSRAAQLAWQNHRAGHAWQSAWDAWYTRHCDS